MLSSLNEFLSAPSYAYLAYLIQLKFRSFSYCSRLSDAVLFLQTDIYIGLSSVEIIGAFVAGLKREPLTHPRGEAGDMLSQVKR